MTVLRSRTATDREPEGVAARVLRAVLTQRTLLLLALLVLVLTTLSTMSAAGVLSASYDPDYLAAALVDVVPVAMLAMAQLVVILSGRGSVDLSVGAIVSLSGMVFGFAYGQWGWPLVPAVLLTTACGTALGAVNGVLVARFRFPALIATLATYYAYRSLAIVVNDQQPISTEPIQELYAVTGAVEIPLIGGQFPDFPLGLWTFLLPAVVLLWLVLARTAYGRRLYAVGTNDEAARWAGLDVAGTRMRAYLISGLLSGVTAVYVTAQFASARPDAGTSGSGLALPAITIAVLGGVAITGGIGRISGVILAALLVTWLNAGILLAVPGDAGTRFQLFALGLLLVASALLNAVATRRYGEAR